MPQKEIQYGNYQRISIHIEPYTYALRLFNGLSMNNLIHVTRYRLGTLSLSRFHYAAAEYGAYVSLSHCQIRLGPMSLSRFWHKPSNKKKSSTGITREYRYISIQVCSRLFNGFSMRYRFQWLFIQKIKGLIFGTEGVIFWD